MNQDRAVTELIDRARRLDSTGRDDLAKECYLEALRLDPKNSAVLNELGNIAVANDHRSAALTCYSQAVLQHPSDPVGRVNLGNMLYQSGDFRAAQLQYEAALAADSECAEAHQGLARTLAALGEDAAAEPHWKRGFEGHAVAVQRYRGSAPGLRVLLLVSVNRGNIPTRHILDDRVFEVVRLHPEYFEPGDPLPPHQIVFNAIGDADQCSFALRKAAILLARTTVPVINPPAHVLVTGRVENAKRLKGVPGVAVPRIRDLPISQLGTASGWSFPFLVRAPGYHTGIHFLKIENRQDLSSVASLPGETALAIDYLDAGTPDGAHRKFRVMFIDGALYPLHLAVSSNWKVHYFTADMARNPRHRDEERRFLDDMASFLGPKVIGALGRIRDRLGLDYAGIDFGLRTDGTVLLFEANATMVIVPPPDDPMWDYRRPSTTRALEAARRMLHVRASRPAPPTG